MALTGVLASRIGVLLILVTERLLRMLCDRLRAFGLVDRFELVRLSRRRDPEWSSEDNVAVTMVTGKQCFSACRDNTKVFLDVSIT